MHEKLLRRGPFVFDSPVYSAIIRTLLYFDIFHYPLKLQEIRRFLGTAVQDCELQSALADLVAGQFIFEHDGYFGVVAGPENVRRRLAGNSKALQMLPVARSRASLIARFPFVKAVMASGSLSKEYMDENSDLDFFIVTTRDRLWVARMILVIYKRIFLGNSSKEFCVNYFVTEDHLEIEEKNEFTATELATVLPLFAPEYYLRLIAGNPWIYNFFPNFVPRTIVHSEKENHRSKAVAESLLNICGGDYLDSFCMWLTKRRWNLLYNSKYSGHDFNIAFKSRKHVSKGHPKHYQKKVTELLNEKWNSYQKIISRDTL